MIQVIEFLAVITSALYGVLLAGRNRMDAVGVISIAFAVAFGGGTLRDLFLDRHPLFWIANDHYAIIVFGIGLVGALIPAAVTRLGKHLAIPDALGMGLFSVTGAVFAIEAGTSPFIAALLGTITGTFGGVIGDVICNKVPDLFKSTTPLSATCAFAGAWVYLMVAMIPGQETLALVSGVAATSLLRLAAIRWNIRLPAPFPDGR